MLIGRTTIRYFIIIHMLKQVLARRGTHHTIHPNWYVRILVASRSLTRHSDNRHLLSSLETVSYSYVRQGHSVDMEEISHVLHQYSYP